MKLDIGKRLSGENLQFFLLLKKYVRNIAYQSGITSNLHPLILQKSTFPTKEKTRNRSDKTFNQ